MAAQPDLASIRLAFVGGGNMARSLIGGLLGRGVAAANIRVAEPNPDAREALARDFAVQVSADGEAAIADADGVLFAVKPQVMRDVCRQLRPALGERALLISIAAGISSAQLNDWLGGGRRVVRAMPNTPALLGLGATGLYANPACSAADRGLASALLGAVGDCAWIDDETQMDVVTALSGSGPAYVFLLAEAMQAAAVELGLPAPAAELLTRQTLLGAAQMLVSTGEPAATLRQRVTSPGGTTQAAIESFERGGFAALVQAAIRAASERGAALCRAAGD